jgi:predicted nucleotidyltransferase
MLSIKESHRTILLSILEKYPYTFYAFGSRTNGSNWEFSDLDLCFFRPMPDAVRYQLEEDLDQSNLPFKVDLVAWHKAPQWFRASIASSLVDIKNNKPITISQDLELSQ